MQDISSAGGTRHAVIAPAPPLWLQEAPTLGKGLLGLAVIGGASFLLISQASWPCGSVAPVAAVWRRQPLPQ